MSREELEKKINVLLSSLRGWTKVIRLESSTYDAPYAHIENGAILSNGQLERKIKTYTIYKDGSVSKIVHL